MRVPQRIRQAAATALLLVLCAGVGRAESPLAEFPAVPPGPPPRVVTQTRVDAALPVLERLARDTMAATGVPGVAIAVVFEDRVAWLEGFGVRAVGRPERVDPDTVFQLASVSKPLASTVVAALAGDGVVRWDDPVVRHDPEFALADPWVGSHATLADLFAHRSGLPAHAGDLLEDLGYTREEVLARLRLEPLAPFRASYAYTNFGLTAAAVAAARSAGKPWEAVSADRLYGPLGMASTTSRFAEYEASPNRAVGHVRDEGGWSAQFVRQPDAQSPAGGAASSARDMAQWLRLQLSGGTLEGREFVAAEPLAETHRPQAISQPPASPAARPGMYGLGWNVGSDDQGRVHLSHSGAFALGASTAVHLVPQERVGIVVLTNGEPIGVPEALSDAFMDLVLQGAVQRDWVTLRARQMQAALHPEPAEDFSRTPARVRPARPTAAYLGTYANDYYGPLRVIEQGEELVMTLGPNGQRFPLRHRDGDVFLYDTTGENATGPGAVRFSVAGESARSVRVDPLDANGLGTFHR